MSDSSSVCFLPLVPENRRRAFFWQFTLLTTLAWMIGGLLAAFIQYNFPIISFNPIFREFFYSLIRGSLIGTAQWFVLRRYRLKTLWIFNTAGGFLISSLVALAWRPVIGGLFGAIAYIWLGLAQWLILRKRVRNAWQWIFVPPLALLAGNVLRLGFLVPIVLLQLPVAPFALVGIEVIAGFIVNAILAALFLRLRRNRIALPTVEEENVRWITERSQLRQLQASLYERLDKAWEAEMTANQPLVYGVAVTPDGEIVRDRPMDAAATEYREQTPLAQLVSPNPAPYSEVAWFEVRFTPTGALKIEPLEAED
ncbi:MAG: hypothetical protein F6K32_14465 [Desertifilum sp. SIO1I2]|nr:hypothetical protein [Desertifilum sp. SIO1I2]